MRREDEEEEDGVRVDGEEEEGKGLCLCDLSAWARGVVTAGAWSLVAVFV